MEPTEQDQAPRLPRGPRHSHQAYRRMMQQSEQTQQLILKFCGLTEQQANKKTRRANAVRRLIFLVHRELGIPTRWHSSKPGPGFKWDGDPELDQAHLQLSDYRAVLQSVVAHVRERLEEELPIPP